MQGTAHMSWIFRYSITYSLLQTFEILVEESLVLEEHAIGGLEL